MNKVKLVGAVVSVASMLAFASPAFAATISNPLFSNGQTTIDANGGATVTGTFTLTVGPGEVVEWLRTQSDPSQPFVDTTVGGQLGYQEQVYTNVPFSVKVPPNTGTVYPTVQGAGIYGGNRSINGGDSVVLGPVNLGTVRVVANTVSSDPIPAGEPAFSWAAMTAFLDKWFSSKVPPTPAKPTYCAGMVTYNGGNAYAAQSWLLATPQAHFFTDIGVYAPTGYWGNASKSAAAGAAAACN